MNHLRTMQHTKFIIDALKTYRPAEMEVTPQSAAVMIILLLDENENIEIVLTKRTTLKTYAGDYSFPGGMRDNDDNDLYRTAVREIEEELGLPSHAYQFVGQLDDFKDHYGHLVRPFITMMQKTDFEKLHRISVAEISAIYYFPLAKLNALEDNPALHPITKRRPSYSYADGDIFIWGLTASILVHLLNVIAETNKSLGKEIP